MKFRFITAKYDQYYYFLRLLIQMTKNKCLGTMELTIIIGAKNSKARTVTGDPTKLTAAYTDAWSSTWMQSWEGLLLLTNSLTTHGEQFSFSFWVQRKYESCNRINAPFQDYIHETCYSYSTKDSNTNQVLLKKNLTFKMTFDLDPNRKQNKMRKCSSELKTIEFLGGALTSSLSDHENKMYSNKVYWKDCWLFLHITK